MHDYNNMTEFYKLLALLFCILQPFPASATTLHFEFYAENPTVSEPSGTSLSSTKKVGQTNLVTYIHIENVDKLGKTPAQIMNDLLKVYNVPQERQVKSFIFYFNEYNSANEIR